MVVVVVVVVAEKVQSASADRECGVRGSFGGQTHSDADAEGQMDGRIDASLSCLLARSLACLLPRLFGDWKIWQDRT